MSPRPSLWAPWRIQYLESDRSGECIFCDLDPPQSDRERLILFRSQSVLILLNRYPYINGHLMVAPTAHRGQLEELDAELQSELMHRISQSARIVRKTYRCDGLNVGANLGAAAGAGFEEHLHFHIVPRWQGDVNFMTSIADTRVISEHLDRTYDALAPQFQELSDA